MYKKLWMCTAAIAMCFSLGTVAMAKDHDHDKDRGERRETRGGYHRARWNDHDRDHRRPAGWDKGKKKGWGDCDAPPGQAKKHGCYDRDHNRDARQRREREEWRRRHAHDARYPHRSGSGTWNRTSQPVRPPQKSNEGPGTWHRPATTTGQNVPPPPPQQQPGSGTWKR